MLEELFFEVGFILIIAAALAMLVFRFRQPLIIAYMIAGILVGPSLLGFAQSEEVFGVMSQIGVAFLLFTVGLGLNWRNVKTVGGIALATGVGQVLFTAIVGFAIGAALGFDPATSGYLAIAFTFSSTIIIIKLLMDKEELDTLYGRISVGFLLVQDLVAMFILLGLGALGTGASLGTVVISTLIKGLIVIPVLWFIGSRVVPPLAAYAARSQELLFVFSIAWCFLIAGLLVAFGFSVELGALLAGVTLSGTLYQNEINARIRPLRDFFLIMFFIVLGTHLELGNLASVIVPTVIFSAFILIGNPIIVMLIMRALGYHPRTGFLAGTTVAQISEFSFIVLTAGIAAGHVGGDAIALAAAVGLLTIAGSSYLIEFNEQIYERLAWMFRWFEPKRVHNVSGLGKKKKPRVMLFGYHRMGSTMMDAIRRMKKDYLIVDFDPKVVRDLADAGEPVVYGDVGDENFLTELEADKARLIVSTIPNITVSLDILTFLNTRDFKGTIIVSVLSFDEALRCYDAGATYVIVPDQLGGERFREFLAGKQLRKQSWKQLGKQARASLEAA